MFAFVISNSRKSMLVLLKLSVFLSQFCILKLFFFWWSLWGFPSGKTWCIQIGNLVSHFLLVRMPFVATQVILFWIFLIILCFTHHIFYPAITQGSQKKSTSWFEWQQQSMSVRRDENKKIVSPSNGTSIFSSFISFPVFINMPHSCCFKPARDIH